MKAGLFAGFSEEMQTLSIELFEEFWDDFVSIVDIEILSIERFHEF